MSKIARYGLVGIFACIVLGSYLSFLAERDAKMFLKQPSELSDLHPDCIHNDCD